MSTPVDPPLSRRAARHAEQSTPVPSNPMPSNPMPLSPTGHDQAFAQPASRRERGGAPVSVPSSAPTDVAYRTQVRPRVPHYDAPPATHTVIPGTPPLAPPSVAPPLAPSATQAPVRRRDFRPPAEQNAAPAVMPSSIAPNESMLTRRAAPADQGFDTALEYHTQLAPRQDAPPMPTATAPSVPPVHEVPLPPATPHEHTLSRRELRALRDHSSDHSSDHSPQHHDDLSADHSRSDVLFAGRDAHAGAATTPEAHTLTADVTPAPPAALVEPAAMPPIGTGPATVGSAPTGSHWSVGIHADDDPFENTFSREVGSTSAATSTNALVLPEMPTASIAGPVSGTGEIIITGMIDLPRTVSSTGTVPTLHDSPDIDDLFDAGDLAAAPPDVAPVSAARAVSSHTQGHSIIAPSKRRPSSNAVTTVLVGATVVMAVVAIGLFVLAAANGLF